MGIARLFDGFFIAGRVFRFGDWVFEERVLDDKLLGWRGRFRLWRIEEEDVLVLGSRLFCVLVGFSFVVF